MPGLKLLTALLIFSVTVSLHAEEPQGEENPLVADTFAKKKKVDHFANFNTVVINHLQAGEMDLEAGVAVLIQKIVIDSNSSSPIAFSIENSGNKIVAGGAVKYGLTDSINLESDLTYANGNTTTTTTTSGSATDSSDKESGLQELKLRAQYVRGMDTFGYAGEVVFIPSIGKASSNAGSNESNAYREQSSLGLTNYLIFSGAGTKWGGLLGYTYNFNGEVESIASNGTSLTREVSGGNSLTAGGFVEFKHLFDMNLQLAYVKENNKTKTSPSGTGTDFPALDYLTFLGTMKFDFTKKIAFVPQFQYTTILNKDADPSFSYTQVDLFGLSGTVRFMF